jgi:hypothetical protein
VQNMPSCLRTLLLQHTARLPGLSLLPMLHCWQPTGLTWYALLAGQLRTTGAGGYDYQYYDSHHNRSYYYIPQPDVYPLNPFRECTATWALIPAASSTCVGICDYPGTSTATHIHLLCLPAATLVCRHLPCHNPVIWQGRGVQHVLVGWQRLKPCWPAGSVWSGLHARHHAGLSSSIVCMQPDALPAPPCPRMQHQLLLLPLHLLQRPTDRARHRTQQAAGNFFCGEGPTVSWLHALLCLVRPALSWGWSSCLSPVRPKLVKPSPRSLAWVLVCACML